MNRIQLLLQRNLVIFVFFVFGFAFISQPSCSRSEGFTKSREVKEIDLDFDKGTLTEETNPSNK